MNEVSNADPPIAQVSSEELKRIERFIAAYNRIDERLQREMESPNTFRSAVDNFARRTPFWRDAETLRTFAALRNFLIHEKLRPFDYPCVPSEAATREIERIGEDLTHPAIIGEVFGREVLTLSPSAPLQSALEQIARRNVSRFPIYQNKDFVGLLTENGIARFLSQIVASGAKFDAQTPIREVLPRETKRRNFRFADSQTSVAQAAFWFHEDTFLEAILISDGGNEKSPLRGIVTRGDVAGWID
ncbi:CBS domain-containing protein [Abditibacterium utsteinense]|uniref:CBS domain-containing protein n=1 Tax=Abditibacterium utsteinense TaxID=1960156 RepID=A0A2S8SUI6_9BACT|nr:CBS domain-containing protein [Abditibacterium utsteinense]PQV64448.1 CBS domain-containing protein [Abditibacterium utsteinense]